VAHVSVRPDDEEVERHGRQIGDSVWQGHRCDRRYRRRFGTGVAARKAGKRSREWCEATRWRVSAGV